MNQQSSTENNLDGQEMAFYAEESLRVGHIDKINLTRPIRSYFNGSHYNLSSYQHPNDATYTYIYVHIFSESKSKDDGFI